MAKLLHIVLGDSAGGSLHQACVKLGMPGEVFPVPDDLSNGPLDDGHARAEYFRKQVPGYGPADVPEDAFASWHELRGEIEARAIDRIVIWYSNTISDLIFLRMACWYLRGFAKETECVNTSVSGWSGVGLLDPKELRACFEHRTHLNSSERERFATEFESVRDRRDLLRGATHGQIVSLPIDHYDAYILSFASGEWKRAVRVVGMCLGDADRHNLIGDMFFSWRLQQLIDAGQLEADGDRSEMRAYRVRKPQP